jgi:hypothetical protein
MGIKGEREIQKTLAGVWRVSSFFSWYTYVSSPLPDRAKRREESS